MKITGELGYKVMGARFNKGDLYSADETFFTGTAAEVTPIKEVYERAIGDGKPGEITKELQSIYFSLVRLKLGDKKVKKIYNKFKYWLAFVH